MYNPNTARSCTGFVITYAGCPLVWASRLQTEVCLSSTESELVALSSATRELVYLLRIVKEAKEIAQLDLRLTNSRIICRVYEEIQGTIAIARISCLTTYQTHQREVLAHRTVHEEPQRHYSYSLDPIGRSDRRYLH